MNDTENMTLEEAREAYQANEEDFDPFASRESQPEAWDRREELWEVLREKSDAEAPECPSCGGQDWAFFPGEPPECRECGIETHTAGQERRVNDWASRVAGWGR